MELEGNMERLMGALLALVAHREVEILQLQEQLRKVQERNAVLESQTRATLRVKLERCGGQLEKLGELALEVVNGPDGSVDIQAAIRLRAFLSGQRVISRADDLAERLAIAAQTNRRSEAARLALHERIRRLEELCAEAARNIPPAVQPIQGYLRLAGDGQDWPNPDEVEL